jgi:hypothetical protein
MAKARATRNSQCRACCLPAGDQAVLERLFCSGASHQSLAARYGMSRWAVARHCRHHLTERRKAELMAGPVKVGELVNAAALESKSLLEYLQVTRGVLFNQFLAAAEAGDRNGVATVAARLLDSLRELGRLTGELRSLSGITVNQTVNIVGSPEFAALADGLLAVARKYPEARPDLIAVIRQLEAPGPNGVAFPMIEGELAGEEMTELAGAH